VKMWNSFRIVAVESIEPPFFEMQNKGPGQLPASSRATERCSGRSSGRSTSAGGPEYRHAAEE
jgi:hypothetical protein